MTLRGKGQIIFLKEKKTFFLFGSSKVKHNVTPKRKKKTSEKHTRKNIKTTNSNNKKKTAGASLPFLGIISQFSLTLVFLRFARWIERRVS